MYAHVFKGARSGMPGAGGVKHPKGSVGVRHHVRSIGSDGYAIEATSTKTLPNGKDIVQSHGRVGGNHPTKEGAQAAADKLNSSHSGGAGAHLAGWVKDYQAQRASGNVAGAKKSRANIDKEVARLGLDRAAVYGAAPEGAGGIAAGGVTGKNAVLPGVSAMQSPLKTGTPLKARDVTFRAGTSDSGTAPSDTSQPGRWLFDSAPGNLGKHSSEGATFAVAGKYGAAKQKAAQQAAAWGHNQLRLAP